MRNDLLLKVTGVNYNGIEEYHFDYYDKINQLLGTIVINEMGMVDWDIYGKNNGENVFLLDQGAKENILNMLSYIINRNVEDDLKSHDFGKQMDEYRWERTIDYIEQNGIYVNYKKINQYYNEDRYDEAMKKRR